MLIDELLNLIRVRRGNRFDELILPGTEQQVLFELPLLPRKFRRPIQFLFARSLRENFAL